MYWRYIEMLKKIIDHIGAGLAIGFIVTTACLWFFGAYEASGLVVMRMYTVWLAASALYGVVSLIYDSELPQPLAVTVHFLGCVAVTFAASAGAGLFEIFSPWPYWFIYVLPTFVAVYLVVGGVNALVERRMAKKINDKIN